MKLFRILFCALFVLTLIPFGVAQDNEGIAGPGEAAEGLQSIIGTVFSQISSFFAMSWIDTEQEFMGFLRFLLWISVFAILFTVGTQVFQNVGDPDAARRNAGIISAVISTITILFTPPALLETIFSMYTSVILFIFLLIPIAAVYYLAYPVLGGFVTNDIALRMLRVLLLLLLWSIVASVTQFAADIPEEWISAGAAGGGTEGGGTEVTPGRGGFALAIPMLSNWLGGKK